MKNAVVTGSTKGIGYAIAKVLLADGYFVFLNYVADDKAAERAVMPDTRRIARNTLMQRRHGADFYIGEYR